MRIFIYELKKMWNWRILALILSMGVLMWFAFLSDALDSYDSLGKHGIYGSYQNEMFALYGATLEPEELAEYDIPGKKAALISEMDEIIAKENIFADNNIYSFMEYEQFRHRGISEDLSKAELEAAYNTLYEMERKLDFGSEEQTLEEWYASPLISFQNLENLEYTYVKYEPGLRSYVDHDERPVVVNAAEKLLKMRNANLIRYDLCMEFSLYAAAVGVAVIVATILLIAPLLINDRMGKLNLLQYPTIVGRSIFPIQFAATMVSTLALSILLIGAAYLPFLAAGASSYWDAPIMSYTVRNIQLYNITFGEYALILAGMVVALSISTACFVFLLARFSGNIVTMMIKVVPVGIAIAGLAVLSINMALSNNNIVFTTIFQGRFHAPEVIVCGFLAVVGMVAAVIIIAREKYADVV